MLASSEDIERPGSALENCGGALARVAKSLRRGIFLFCDDGKFHPAQLAARRCVGDSPCVRPSPHRPKKMSSTGVTGVPTTRNWRAGSKRAPRFTPRTVAQIAPSVLAPPPVPQLAGAKKTPDGWLRCFALCLKLDVPPPPPIRRKPTKLRLKRREAPTESWQESQRATLQLTAVPQLASPPSRQAVLQAAATLQRELGGRGAARARGGDGEREGPRVHRGAADGGARVVAAAAAQRLAASRASPSPASRAPRSRIWPPCRRACRRRRRRPPARSPVSPTFAPLPPERLPPPPPPRAGPRHHARRRRAVRGRRAVAARTRGARELQPPRLCDAAARRRHPRRARPARRPARRPSRRRGPRRRRPALAPAAAPACRADRRRRRRAAGPAPPPPPRASRLVPAAAAPAEDSSAERRRIRAGHGVDAGPAEPPPAPPPRAPPAPPPRRRFLSLPVGRSKPTEATSATARPALRMRLKRSTSTPWGRRGLWRGAAPAPADADESRC